MENGVEGAAATRKDLTGGDPWGLPATGVDDSGGAGRHREGDRKL
jgi:hypothetical protein